MQRKIKLPSANSSPQAKLYWNENVDIDNYLQTVEYTLIMRQICRTPIICHPREATATKKWTFPRETWRQTQERMEERARRVRKVLAIMRNTTHTPKSDELDITPRVFGFTGKPVTSPANRCTLQWILEKNCPRITSTAFRGLQIQNTTSILIDQFYLWTRALLPRAGFS